MIKITLRENMSKVSGLISKLLLSRRNNSWDKTWDVLLHKHRRLCSCLPTTVYSYQSSNSKRKNPESLIQTNYGITGRASWKSSYGRWYIKAV